MNSDERARLLRDAIRATAERCPRLIAECYWAGTSTIALEEIGHRESFDLDFHSRHAFADGYPDVAPGDATAMRDELLRLLKMEVDPR